MVSAVVSAVRAELTKLWTLRGVRIGTAAILALHVLVLAQTLRLNADAVAAIAPDGTIELFVGERAPAGPAMIEQLVAGSLQMCLFLPFLGVLIAGQEFRGGQLGVSVLAVPRRGRLLAAKWLAAALHLLLTALLIAAVSTAAILHAVRDWHPGLLLSAAAMRGQLQVVAFAVLFALIGFAATLIARRTVAGVFVTIALITVTMTQVLAGIAPGLDALFPLSAGRNLLLDGTTSRLTAGPAHAALVLAGWTVAGIALAARGLARRDAA